MNTCEICGKEIKETATTCSSKCRQKLYRRRKNERNVTDVTPTTQTLPKGYIMVPEREWNRLMEMVTDLSLRGTSYPKQSPSSKESPIDMKPIDNSDIVLEVKQSQDKQKANPNANFLASMAAFG